MGHFLCLDRWGPATETETEMGMGWHGEASRSWWSVRQAPTHADGRVQAQMAATLPLAGLEVLRTIRLHDDQAIFTVREDVTNTRTSVVFTTSFSTQPSDLLSSTKARS